MSKINTVTGPVSAGQLGRTLIHEHFIFGYPGYGGDLTMAPFNREAALKKADGVLEKLKNFGVGTVLDATPNDTGRDPEFLREISEKAGINIICVTGYYYEAAGAAAYFKFRQSMGDIIEEIYEMFMREITVGIGKSGIKAGAIKVASGKNSITPYEEAFFRAAAKAQRETGVAIITHTEEGTMGLEQAELLIAEGVEPAKIMIGHMCCNTDLALHVRLLLKRVYLGFDRFGLQVVNGAPPEIVRTASLLGLLGAGFENQLLISHDKINFWLGRRPVTPPERKKLLAQWRMTHVFEDVLPLLEKAGVTSKQIRQMLVDNPRELLEVRG